jgi:hypothetical protein
MRPGPNLKRQRGRNNGRNRPHMPVRAQTFDSNGPDVRIRGNAYQVLEKYLALARDAQAAGDRIAAENFYQHAEHYYRLINANGGPERQPGNSGYHQGGDEFGQHQHMDPGTGPQPYAGGPDGEGHGGGGSGPNGPNGTEVPTH